MQEFEDTLEDKPLSERTDFLEQLVRLCIGRDLEIGDYDCCDSSSIIRGPIKTAGVIFFDEECNEPRLFLKLAWAAELTNGKWKLYQEPKTTEELQEGILFYDTYLSNTYVELLEDEKTYWLIPSLAPDCAIIRPMGDNLRRGKHI